MRNHLRNIAAHARESGRPANQPATNVLATEAIRLARVAASIHLMAAANDRAGAEDDAGASKTVPATRMLTEARS